MESPPAIQTPLPTRAAWPARPAPRVPARALSLVHPGPSVLVTACFVAAWGAARRSVPDPGTALRLAAVMLPIQFAIGALNDLCDRDLDRLGAKPKPLVDGTLGPAAAVLVSVLGFGLGVGMAASFPLPTLPLAVLAAAAGASYDLGLKRGRLSWLPWWIGFTSLPLLAWAAAGQPEPRLLAAAPPLALALSFSLQLANALPDIAGDRRAGSGGLAIRLGWRATRRLALGLSGLAAAAAVLGAPLLGQDLALVVGGAVPLLAGAVVLGLRPAWRHFPILAVGAAILAATWLIALG
ncbi:MAG TPA: UbiA family prenyltransferase [Candidatus Binatia bacterium]|nr:UbiA family prenyltransferase [Candidatus Binatia bacterium]